MNLDRFGLTTDEKTASPRTTSATAAPAQAKVVERTIRDRDDPRRGMAKPIVAPEQMAPEDREGFLARVQRAAEEIRTVCDTALAEGRTPRALLFSDMDVDGITSHTIMRTVYERLGFEVEPVFSKKFSDDIMDRLRRADHDIVTVTDHGSPARDAFGDPPILVLDHHKPPDPDQDHSHQVHPMLYGLNGAVEVCSAGIGYLVARAIDAEANRDLSVMGVIGSAGDMLDLDHGRFVGITASEVVEDAVRAGLLERKTDIRLYGRHGRSLKQLFQYADDPRFEGLSKNEVAVTRFLTAQGLNPEQRWCRLDQETRGRLVGHLLERASDPDRVLGEVYELANEEIGGHLRDVKEFGTLINGSSRYEMPEPVIAVLKGDRGRKYQQAVDNYLNHKRNIMKAIRLMHELGVKQTAHLQWVHVEGLVRHTIVGSVAGAVQGRYDPNKPIIAFAYEAEDLTKTKVSGRGTRHLCQEGLDLSRVMRECAETLGGKGGGHDVAAGATIPAGTEERFIDMADAIVGEQLGHLHR